MAPDRSRRTSRAGRPAAAPNARRRPPRSRSRIDLHRRSAAAPRRRAPAGAGAQPPAVERREVHRGRRHASPPRPRGMRRRRFADPHRRHRHRHRANPISIVAFEPFTQIDGSLARRFDGAGLGLYVSRALVQAHGGELVLQSRPGVGHHGRDPLAARTSGRRGTTRRQEDPIMTALAVTDRLFFDASPTAPRSTATAPTRTSGRGAGPRRRRRAVPGIPRKRDRSAWTTGASAAPASTPRWASACAPSPGRRPAMPTPANCRTPRWSGPRPVRCRRRGRPCTAPWPSRRARPIRGSIRTPTRCRRWRFGAAPPCWRRSMPMRAARIRASSR